LKYLAASKLASAADSKNIIIKGLATLAAKAYSLATGGMSLSNVTLAGTTEAATLSMGGLAAAIGAVVAVIAIFVAAIYGIVKAY